ncbi:serine/threonine-protein kinase [Pseudonocardia endophytica]|uniref:non-specific serine/threonine protein kinase n=1 Tax=Pseudonocardia endophytica TaxID=401976 RepID=A0A4R1HWT3_PSEEN|nr:serine/threonine-protein kinase [Pseudonocardia endophytica]TCK27204.1 serine/threonine protein kinase [Pseudonocardia endophytica]
MPRGDDPDRTRRGDTWQTGNHRRPPQRGDGDPATRRHGRPDDPDATRHAGPPDPGATRRVGPGDPGATRRVGPGDPDATRRVDDPGAPTRWTGAGADPGVTRRVDPGDGPTRNLGGPVRAPQPSATRMLPQPVGGPELLGGRYRLEGLIGQGGMADVHRATDTRLNRPVAVKIFGPGNDPTADQRFSQEAQVMANLHHPGLVGVHDFAVEPHRAYLVMELVDGPTLRQVIESEQLPPDEIRRIGLDVAQTLDYVHGQGVTHRDVKPSNILLGADGRAKLADFGVASLLGADGHTAAGEIVGTPAYLAPEQIRGGEVGPPADVYALGLVLLECWTGRQEYQGEGIEGAAERLNRSPVVPRDTPEPLREAITEMTRTDPRGRPSARDAAGILSESAPPPTAPPPPADVERDEPRDPGSSGTGRWIAIGAFVIALLVLVIGLLLWNNRDSDTPAAPQTTTSESRTTTEAPTSGNQGPGFSIPSIPTQLPSGIPTQLPSLPSGIPTQIPSIPTSLPNIPDDASGFWKDIQDWWNNLF